MTLQIHQTILDLIDAKQPFAVAQIIRADGSTPLKTGARAVIEANGNLHGTIGGGLAESEAQQRAIKACHSGQACVYDFELYGTDAGEASPVCGGLMRVLIDPNASVHKKIYAQAVAALLKRQRSVLVTRVTSPAQTDIHLEWLSEKKAAETDTMQSSLAQETPRSLRESDTDILIEPLIPNPRLIIVGAGHVGRALAQQAVLVNFDVTVVDDRPEFAEPTRFPNTVQIQCGDIVQQVEALVTLPDTYVVLVTRGHRHDAEALKICINKPLAYLGMIGSKQKVALVRKHFIAEGIATETQFDLVHAPIGLEIGSLTAPEIAASIVAQLIAVRRTGQSP